jgi:hypothetical protein
MRAGRSANDERRCRDLNDHVAFGARQAGGNRLRCRAEFPCGKAGLIKADAIGEPDGDEIAFLDA